MKQKMLHTVCSHLTSVPFSLRYWDGRLDQFGDGAPQFEVAIHDPSVVLPVMRTPDPAFGEAYMNGAVEVDNLEQALSALQNAQSPLPQLLHLPHRATPITRQYREVQSHYDLGNDFFSLWLDASKTYSCGYFRNEGDTLEEAQQAKIDHVLHKANLREGDSLLDIGSGWGALVLKAARDYKVRARGITVSQEQCHHSEEAIAAAGLTDKACVKLLDYRELAERGATFDRIVSIGMLEHVGKRNLPVFLKAVKQLLKPGGVCVLHFITHDKEYEIGAWVRRHIFPGGYIPSWREVISLLPDYNFNLIDAESLRRHYALTLTSWADRFEAHLPEVRAQGFDERFIRMWRLYLRGSAAGFKCGNLDLHQLVFTNGVNNDLPMTREHLYSSSGAVH